MGYFISHTLTETFNDLSQWAKHIYQTLIQNISINKSFTEIPPTIKAD